MLAPVANGIDAFDWIMQYDELDADDTEIFAFLLEYAKKALPDAKFGQLVKRLVSKAYEINQISLINILFNEKNALIIRWFKLRDEENTCHLLKSKLSLSKQWIT